jgi:hypothetical protein
LKILKKNENIAKIAPPQPPKTAKKALQKTAKKTYAEIAKINNLMTK